MKTTNTTDLKPAARLNGLPPYQPPSYEWDIDLRLDANEGTLPSAAMLDGLHSVDGEALRRYPNSSVLEQRVARRWDVDTSRIIVTNGGDDAIDRLCRATINPGDRVVLHRPTFEMIERYATLAGAEITSVDWLDGPFPIDAMLDAINSGVKLVALVSPNNPSGAIIQTPAAVKIVKAAQSVGAVVLIDLAYVEFADEDPTPSLLEYANVIIVRTFSKARGLAGCRVGYAIGPADVIEWMRTVGGPYPVSNTSLLLAGASLDEDDDASNSVSVQSIRSERSRLASQLRSLGVDVIESQANFVTARFRDAEFVFRALASLGIAVRRFTLKPELTGFLRITLPGRAADFNRLQRALNTALAPQAILFDLDGVIADVSKSYRACICAAAESFGISITSGDVARAKQAGDANNDWELTQRLMQARGLDIPLDDVIARFQSIYLGVNGRSGKRENEALIPSVAQLTRFAEHRSIAIVTGRPRNEAEWFLDRAGIRDLFPVRVCMEDAPAKPSPEPILQALEKLGVDAAWMIGDTPDDMEAARSAGVMPVGFIPPSERDRVAFEHVLRRTGAARVVSSFDQLEDLLP